MGAAPAVPHTDANLRDGPTSCDADGNEITGSDVYFNEHGNTNRYLNGDAYTDQYRNRNVNTHSD